MAERPRFASGAVQIRGLVATDGDTYTKSSSIGPGISRRRLEERFGAALTTMPEHTFAPTRKISPVPSLQSYGYDFGKL